MHCCMSINKLLVNRRTRAAPRYRVLRREKGIGNLRRGEAALHPADFDGPDDSPRDILRYTCLPGKSLRTKSRRADRGPVLTF